MKHIDNPLRNSFDIVNGRMDGVRFYSTATLLSDGRVLVIGGYDNNCSKRKIVALQASNNKNRDLTNPFTTIQIFDSKY
jgi:hypothetical protein